MRKRLLIYFAIILIGFGSCAKSELDFDIGRLKVINQTDLPHAVFVRPVADSTTIERYFGTIPVKAHILVPIRANEAYEIKIGEVNTGRIDKFKSIVTLQKDETVDLVFEGIK